MKQTIVVTPNDIKRWKLEGAIEALDLAYWKIDKVNLRRNNQFDAQEAIDEQKGELQAKLDKLGGKYK